MEKEAVKELLEAWYAAEKTVVYETTSDYTRDLKDLEKEKLQWELRLGLKTE